MWCDDGHDAYPWPSSHHTSLIAELRSGRAEIPYEHHHAYVCEFAYAC